MNKSWSIKYKRIRERNHDPYTYMRKCSKYEFNSRAYDDFYLVISEYEPTSLSILYSFRIADLIKEARKQPRIKLIISFDSKCNNFELYYNVSARLVKSMIELTRNRCLFAPELNFVFDSHCFNLELLIYETLTAEEKNKYFQFPYWSYDSLLRESINGDELIDFDEIKRSIKHEYKHEPLSTLALAYSYQLTLISNIFKVIDPDDYEDTEHVVHEKRLRDTVIDGQEAIEKLLDEYKELAKRYSIEIKEFKNENEALRFIEFTLLAMKAYISDNITVPSARYSSMLTTYNQTYSYWESRL